MNRPVEALALKMAPKLALALAIATVCSVC